MRRFLLRLQTPDEIDLVGFGVDLNSLLIKYCGKGILDEVINPLILDNNKGDRPELQ